MVQEYSFDTPEHGSSAAKDTVDEIKESEETPMTILAYMQKMRLEREPASKEEI